MDFLKALFENGAITWEQFSQAVTEKGYKLADLSTGNYVAKGKYDDDIKTRDTRISELNSQITTRDTDIKNLQKQLKDGSTDSETKVADLTTQLANLTSTYKTEKQAYEQKLSAQAYEFAVKEYAGTQQFSSNAAKRDFITEMTNAKLQMQDKTIFGADDFAKVYREKNADAFVVEQPATPAPEAPKPTFVQPTPPAPAPEANPFEFNFAGVR